MSTSPSSSKDKVYEGGGAHPDSADSAYKNEEIGRYAPLTMNTERSEQPRAGETAGGEPASLPPESEPVNLYPMLNQ